MIHKIEQKTFVSSAILFNEYDYLYGDERDKRVDFTFRQVLTCKENTKKGAFTYRQALSLAREKRNDMRYKNFEFIIG